jgi:hypothetical protein
MIKDFKFMRILLLAAESRDAERRARGGRVKSV